MTMESLQLLLPFFSFFLLFFFILFLKKDNNNGGLPTNWPILGMLPSLLKNVHRIHDFCVELMENSPLTFLIVGPWFSNMDMLLTVDPSNIHYIMSKNFTNYPKGPKFNDIFDILGDGIFNADFEVWKYHRKMAKSFLSQPEFREFLIRNVSGKTRKGLIPILEQTCKQGLVVDLQDLFERFTFDNICALVMGHDLESLSINLPKFPFSKALDDAEEATFYRHVIPTKIWKLMRLLRVGKEEKLRQAWKVLDEFIYKCIEGKKRDLRREFSNKNDLLTLYMAEKDKETNRDKFFRDTILNFFIAGRDTTSSSLSWFFYLLSNNPKVESKIREELTSVLQENFLGENFDEVSDKLVYLHGALCEALRLYPPVVFEAKSPVKTDILPSGHKVCPKTQIVFNLYATGRMKQIWGENCREFLPERWVTDSGKIRHEPSYKFLAFNAGPRSCVGKDMAFTQMKLVVATLIQCYRIEVVKDHRVCPDISIILRMKYGLKVRVFRNE